MSDVINDLISNTQKKLGITFFIISHDVKGALKIAHRIAMLYEGRIVEEGTPEEIESSPSPIVQQFLSGSSEGPISAS
jgi:phospholipid/cholesterol/gamma-HCH transport system ATP-binding protein